eukprot:11163503-Lingulodinium_polyedra.AAC.1
MDVMVVATDRALAAADAASPEGNFFANGADVERYLAEHVDAVGVPKSGVPGLRLRFLPLGATRAGPAS